MEVARTTIAVERKSVVDRVQALSAPACEARARCYPIPDPALAQSGQHVALIKQHRPVTQTQRHGRHPHPLSGVHLLCLLVLVCSLPPLSPRKRSDMHPVQFRHPARSNLIGSSRIDEFMPYTIGGRTSMDTLTLITDTDQVRRGSSVGSTTSRRDGRDSDQ